MDVEVQDLHRAVGSREEEEVVVVQPAFAEHPEQCPRLPVDTADLHECVAARLANGLADIAAESETLLDALRKLLLDRSRGLEIARASFEEPIEVLQGMNLL